MVSTNTIIAATALAFFQAVAAQDASAIASALGALESAIQTTNSDVKAFDKSQGINGALSIQTTEADIESAAKAVTSAITSASGLTCADAATLASPLEGVTSAIADFTSSLISKASDLIAVGTQQIVAGDIHSLSGLTFDLQSAAFKQLPNGAVPVLESNFAGINGDFSSLASAFSGSLDGSAPSAPEATETCGASAAATTSAAETSAAAATTSAAAETSAAATTAAETTAAETSAAATTSAAESSSAAATTVATSAVATENGTSTSTAPSVIESNGASMFTVSGALAAVGVAALLL